MPIEVERLQPLIDQLQRASRPFARLQEKLAPLSALSALLNEDGSLRLGPPVLLRNSKELPPAPVVGGVDDNGRESSSGPRLPPETPLVAAERRASRAVRSGRGPKRRRVSALDAPLSDGARAIALVLCSIPPAEKRTAKQIVAAASKLKRPDRTLLDEHAVRWRHFAELKPWGMRSHQRSGYYIPMAERAALMAHLGR